MLLMEQGQMGVVAVLLLSLAISPVAAGEGPLAGHSIPEKINTNQIADQWFMAGTIIPSSKNGLVLNPGVPGRVGMLWSPHPLLTADFQVELHLDVKAPEKRTVTEEGFAFWYVYENAAEVHKNVTTEYVRNQDAIIANTWDMALKMAGLDLFGYRSKFDGLGVLFGSDKATLPTVSVAINDGLTPQTHAGLFAATEENQRFERKDDFWVKIRVTPTEATIEVVGKGIQKIKGSFKAGGYIGITSVGGQKGTMEHIEKSDVVVLREMKVTNMDKNADGEKMPTTTVAPVAAATKVEEKEDLLGKTSSHKDHRAESDAIKDLTNMVFKLVAETQPIRAQLNTAINSLGTRMTAMEKTFELLKQEIDKKTGHHLSAEFDAIKKELATLSTVATKETKERHQRLDTLHTHITDVHKTAQSSDFIDTHLNKLTQSNQRTLDSLSNEHQRNFGVSIAAIAFVVIAGLSLYNKFRCWEKKHIL